MQNRLSAIMEKVNAQAGGASRRWTHLKSVPFGLDQVHVLQLGNGLRLLLLVDATAPTVSYFTWFRVGSRHERPGKTGLAHLFEHERLWVNCSTILEMLHGKAHILPALVGVAVFV